MYSIPSRVDAFQQTVIRQHAKNCPSKTFILDGENSQVLRQAEVVIRSDVWCRRSHPQYRGTSQICALGLNGQQDTCQVHM